MALLGRGLWEATEGTWASKGPQRGQFEGANSQLHLLPPEPWGPHFGSGDQPRLGVCSRRKEQFLQTLTAPLDSETLSFSTLGMPPPELRSCTCPAQRDRKHETNRPVGTTPMASSGKTRAVCRNFLLSPEDFHCLIKTLKA